MYKKKKIIKKRVNPADLRDNQVKVSLSNSELEIIEQKAFKARLSLSAYFRNCGLGKEIKQALTSEELALIRDLAGISNNLNQVTKALHKEGVLKAATKVESVINHLEKILNF